MLTTIGRVHDAHRQARNRGAEPRRGRCAVGIFLMLALGSLVAPRTTAAQHHGNIPLVGVLRPNYPPDLSPPSDALVLAFNAFGQGLRDLGYVEGQTIRLEYRYAAYQWDRLPALAAELVQLQPAVIVTNTTQAVLAAQQATTTIPIVQAIGGDLAELGLVASLARPGSNITGLILRDLELGSKRLELLKDAAPTISHVAILTDPSGLDYSHVLSPFEKAARALGVQLSRVDAGTPAAIPDALAAIAHSGAEALMIADTSMLNAHRQRILDFARMHRLPTVCGVRAYAKAGCLMAYAPNLDEMWRRAAAFVDKILKGAKPADLPVEQPAKFRLVINLTTAQALGLTIPPALLFQADEVIQ
jgi:putative tryptophan/tyrosine transport system substrate-binding protein